MNTYGKHLLKELFKLTFFSLFFLSITIDLILYSTYSHSSLSFTKWLDYLFCHKVLLLYFLLPLSFVIASVFICYQKRKDLEFLALFSSGVPKVKIFTPFILFALIITVTLFANDHFFFPRANEIVYKMKSKISKREKHRDRLSVLNLLDYKLVLNNYQPDDTELYDLYLIESPEKIWHFEHYNLNKQIATNVDLFEKKDSFFSKTLSLEQKHFKIDQKELVLSQIPFDRVNLRFLLSLNKKSLFTEKKKRVISSSIHQKISYFFLPMVLACLISSFFIKSFTQRFFLQTLLLFPLAFGLYFFISLFTTLFQLGITSTVSIYLASMICLSFLFVKARLYPY